MEPSTSAMMLDADMLNIIEKTLVDEEKLRIDAKKSRIDAEKSRSNVEKSPIGAKKSQIDTEKSQSSVEISQKYAPTPGMISVFIHNIPLAVSQDKFDSYMKSHGVPVYNACVEARKKKKRNVGYVDVATLQDFEQLKSKVIKEKLCGENVQIMLNPSTAAKHETKRKNIAQSERDDTLASNQGKNIIVEVGNISIDTNQQEILDYFDTLEVNVYLSSKLKLKKVQERELVESDGELKYMYAPCGFKQHASIEVESLEDLKILQSRDRVLHEQKLVFEERRPRKPKKNSNGKRKSKVSLDEPPSKKQKVDDITSKIYNPKLVEKLGLETVKAAYEQEQDLKLNLLLKCDQLPPAEKKKVDVQFCMLCEENDHCRKSECQKYKNDHWLKFQDLKGEYVDIYGIRSSTAYEQINQLVLRNCHVVVCDRKLYNLICYICDMKFENKVEYDTHMQGEAHSSEQRLDDVIFSRIMGNPKRIPNLTRLSQLPSVFEENDCADYLFLCSVCAHVVPGPASKHVEGKRHQYKLKHSPRCVTCNLFLLDRVPRSADNNLIKHGYGDFHQRMKELKRKMKEDKGVNEIVEIKEGEELNEMKEDNDLNEGLKDGEKCGDKEMQEKD